MFGDFARALGNFADMFGNDKRIIIEFGDSIK
jgi:hypothetical protein